MKKVLGFICLVVILISGVGYAQGLDNFTDKNKYIDDLFTDVSMEDWYYDGVRSVYEKGIMNGVSENGFLPQENVTWAQAVTIASRMSAIYTGKDIIESGDLWYEKYLRFAEENSIISGKTPDIFEMETRFITRQEIANMFSRVFFSIDMPMINNSSIPDISIVDAEYKDAVISMYGSGIITGKEGGNFDPFGLTTRAEIATIISRLINPALRVGNDINISQFMKTQSGNFYNGGIACELDGNVYYICYDLSDSGEKTYSIICRTINGMVSQKYISSNEISYLSHSDEGNLYFVEDDTLYELNLTTLKKKKIYDADFSLYTYGLYNKKLYVFEEYTGNVKPDEQVYRIVETDGNSKNKIIDNLTFSETLYTDDCIYFFMNKMYICLSKTEKTGDKEMIKDQIVEIDLQSKKKRTILDASAKKVVFTGACAYFVKDNSLKRINLLFPDFVENISDLPEDFNKSYSNFFANSEELYYQSSGARKLWKVFTDGRVETLVTFDKENKEYSTITSQGIILQSIKNIGKLVLWQVDVVDNSGKNLCYIAFLKRPYIVAGKADFEKKEETYSSDFAPRDMDGVISKPISRYFTVDGDFVVELEIENQTADVIKLNNMNFLVKCENNDYNRQFQLLTDVNSGETKTYTIVFPAEIIGKNSYKTGAKFNIGFSVGRKNR